MSRPARFALRPLAILIALAPFASSAEDAKLDPVVVSAQKDEQPATATEVNSAAVAAARASTSDAASLLRDVPGVSLYGAGGVSSLPAIHGLADDRLRIKVDGMDLISACPNHMNSPLSYIDPTSVGAVKVYAGIAPVSVGGDSIGGSVVMDSAAPTFAAPGQGSLFKGEIGAFYRSNGDGKGANLSATYATEAFNVTYAASTAEADDYKAGGDFKTFTATGRPGVDLAKDLVGSTAYKARNQSLGFALRGERDLVELKFGYQDIPYELYPNQRMDMLGNTQHSINLRYLGQRDWGTLEARAYHQKVDHYMDFGADKKYIYGPNPPNTVVAPGMPMYTEATTDGLAAKAEIELTKQDLVRFGGEYQRYRLNDCWPPSPSSLAGMFSAPGVPATTGGMAPNTFWNIKDGKRDRLASFAEWEARWNPQWLSLLGVRLERVTTDTGAVQGYNTTAMYATSSVGTTAQFNALDRQRTDTNRDLTTLGRYTPNANYTLEFGYAQKTRSPNLYERYSWSRNAMALVMNNFVGDGNGYLGNPDLKPEVAHTLSATGDWHSADRSYELKATPYYTRVTDYIDAVQWNRTTNLAASPLVANNFVVLKYMNQSARLYGLDISGRMPLAKNNWGDWGLKGLLNYTIGKNLDTGYGLYNIMPLNAKLTLTHQLGGWDDAIELVGVQAKDHLSTARNEIRTPGYSLVNLRASYSWTKVRVDVAVENLFNKLYYLPLGGAYSGQGTTMSITGIPWGIAVAGAGRSINTGVTIKF